MALQLMLRAPVRFSVAILLLGCVDAFVLNLLPSVIPQPWTRRLGMLLLPLAWVVVAALARGADDPSQNWRVLKCFLKLRTWLAALAIGLGLIALDLIIQRLLFPNLDSDSVKLHPGRVLSLIGAQAWIVTEAAGICFFPLLVLETGLSYQEVRHLSRSASEINGQREIARLMFALILAAAVLTLLAPAYGLSSAAWIVFVGVVNYVAYRDIFERREANLPLSRTDPIEASVAHPVQNPQAS